MPAAEAAGKHGAKNNAKTKQVPVKTLGQEPLSTQDAWQKAADSESQVELDDDSLNAHFAYDDDDAHVRHQVWFLDATTVLNEMRGARTLGIADLMRSGNSARKTIRCGRSGTIPLTSDPVKELTQVEPGYDVDTEGEGDILRVTRKPQNGRRVVTMDDDDSVPVDYRMITQESMDSYPLSYTVDAVRLPPEQGRAQLRRRPRSGVDAEDSRHSEREERQRHVLHDRRDRRRLHRSDAAGCIAKATRSATIPAPIRTSAKSRNRQVDLELNLTERLFASEARRAAALLPAALLHRPGARHQRPGRTGRTDQRTSGTLSSATRSTPTTGTSIHARHRRRSSTAYSTSSRRWSASPGHEAPSSCCTTAAVTGPSPFRRCRC